MTNISTEDYSEEADLKRGAEYYKQAHETTQKETVNFESSLSVMKTCRIAAEKDQY